jgi:hypothetical protein
LVLLVTPWIALCLYGNARASAASTTDAARSTAAARPSSPVPAHGVSRPAAPLSFTGADALLLVGFLGAVVVPGTGLLVVARRQRKVGSQSRHVAVL